MEGVEYAAITGDKREEILPVLASAGVDLVGRSSFVRTNMEPVLALEHVSLAVDAAVIRSCSFHSQKHQQELHVGREPEIDGHVTPVAGNEVNGFLIRVALAARGFTGIVFVVSVAAVAISQTALALLSPRQSSSP